MFVQGNGISDIKAYFSKELSHLFSANELKQIVKHLTVNRFKISDSEYILFSNNKLSESDLLYYHWALKRLRNEEPFQYVLGETEFCGLKIKVDERALIPRPETEELVEWIKETITIDAPTITDLCTGSGCIALALKSIYPKGDVLAVDESIEAISLVDENRTILDLDVQLLQADVLEPNVYPTFDREQTDVIVSNPPYIPTKDKSLMADNVLKYEPHMALFVEDDDPLVFYRVIAENSGYNLKEGGWLFFEIHEELSKGVVELMKNAGFVNIEVRKDLQGKDRMVKGQKLSSRHGSK
jgi:release factor glutamine methyltransferase